MSDTTVVTTTDEPEPDPVTPEDTAQVENVAVTGAAAGAAAVHATNAEEAATEAQAAASNVRFEAEIAETSAAASASAAIEATTARDDTLAAVSALSEQITQLQSMVQTPAPTLVEHESTPDNVPGESEETTTASTKTHWLNRRWGGKRG